jgi:hypothetical protein
MKIHDILDSIRKETDPNKRLTHAKTLYRNPVLSAIREHAKCGRYREAYRKLYRFIGNNYESLSLVPVRIAKDAARLLSGDRNLFPRNAVRIVTKHELIRLLARHAGKPETRSFSRIERLLDLADRKQAALITACRTTSPKEAYRELSHDFHAWLMAGSVDNPGWKTGLLRTNIHRRLDAFVWGQKRIAIPAVPRIAELLTSRSLLTRIDKLHMDGWDDTVYLYESRGTANGRKFSAYGASFRSPEIARTKCIGETVERAYLLGAGKDAGAWKGEYFGSGLAAGSDRDKAVLNASYELVERDCLMTGYLNRVHAPSIGKDEVEQYLRNNPSVLRVLYGKNVETYAFDITNDLRIPSVLMILADRNHRVRVSGKQLPLIAGGIKANLNIKEAVRGAAEELLLEWALKLRHWNVQNGSTAAAWARKATLDTHRLFRFYTKGTDAAKNGTVNSALRNAQAELKLLERMLKDSGFVLTFENISLPVSGSAGYYLVRARIPGLQPLSALEGSSPVSSPRLEKVKNHFYGHR